MTQKNMTPDKYASTQHFLLTIAGMVAQLDLPAFLECIETAHAIGPVADPTLYRAGAGGMDKIGAIARAALPLRAEVLKQIEEEETKQTKETPPWAATS